MIPVESIDKPSIDKEEPVDTINTIKYCSAHDPTDKADWRTEICDLLSDEVLPNDKWVARRLRIKAAKYTLMKEFLLKVSASGAMLNCIHGDEVNEIMKETHEGA